MNMRLRYAPAGAILLAALAGAAHAATKITIGFTPVTGNLAA